MGVSLIVQEMMDRLLIFALEGETVMAFLEIAGTGEIALDENHPLETIVAMGNREIAVGADDDGYMITPKQ